MLPPKAGTSTFETANVQDYLGCVFGPTTKTFLLEFSRKEIRLSFTLFILFPFPLVLVQN